MVKTNVSFGILLLTRQLSVIFTNVENVQDSAENLCQFGVVNGNVSPN